MADQVTASATTVITQRNKDSIHARYERLQGGDTKPTLAKLSLTRMIAATMLRMWKCALRSYPMEGGASPIFPTAGKYHSDDSGDPPVILHPRRAIVRTVVGFACWSFHVKSAGRAEASCSFVYASRGQS